MDDWEVFLYDEDDGYVSSLYEYFDQDDIDLLVKEHPKIIYFYASLIPYAEPEIDYNTVVRYDPATGVHHTYSPTCPEGCYGQLEDCVYRQERWHTNG